MCWWVATLSREPEPINIGMLSPPRCGIAARPRACNAFAFAFPGLWASMALAVALTKRQGVIFMLAPGERVATGRRGVPTNV